MRRRQPFYNDDWGCMKFRYVALLLVMIGAVVVFALVWGIAAFDGAYQHRQCNRFEREAGRDTKYVRFSHWTYTCFVKVNGNKYVTIDQFRGADVEK